ncbi:Raptor N-terminal CASPase like domain [Fragilaria crotonensis]|nr:Raptor N-terminal CASPase like domain [Fragilaria crotonensis]
MPFLTAPLESNDATPPQTPNPTSFQGDDLETVASQWIRDTIVLSPTSENEWLPMHPDYPADIFTSCLTTPIKMALRWFVRRNPQSMGSLNPDVVDAIPGKATDRKTPLGDLNWIFTSVTDSIAWNILPKPLFQRLFRQDLMVASLFRNFLLADRILRSLNCSPQSFPLSSRSLRSPLWQAWDLACETCLCGLMKDGILNNQVLLATQPDPENDGEEDSALNDSKPDVTQQPVAAGSSSCVTSPFFSEQLTAFEIWLEFASIRKANRVNEPLDSPEQLPVVLQLLLSQAHRERALALLSQFLDLGPWAVSVALSVGIFPYVMKLWLSQERKQYLVGIWARIISFDSSCQVELVKDGALPHFVQHLTWGLNRATMNLPLNPVEASEQRILAAFILSAICVEYPQGQLACIRLNLHGTSCALLSSAELPQDSSLDPDYQKKAALAEARVPPMFRTWLCLCLGNLFNGNVTSQTEGLASGVHLRLFSRLQDDSPEVRAAACFAIACLLRPPPVPEAHPMLPPVPLVPPSQTTFNAVPLSSTSSQGNRLYPQQPMIPPQTPTAEREFPGRLQPSFVHPERGAPAWHPQQLLCSVCATHRKTPDKHFEHSLVNTNKNSD